MAVAGMDGGNAPFIALNGDGVLEGGKVETAVQWGQMTGSPRLKGELVSVYLHRDRTFSVRYDGLPRSFLLKGQPGFAGKVCVFM